MMNWKKLVRRFGAVFSGAFVLGFFLFVTFSGFELTTIPYSAGFAFFVTAMLEFYKITKG
jgi:hypothetical protein